MSYERKVKGSLEDVDYESPIVVYRANKLTKTYKKTYNENVNPSIAVDVFYTLYLPYPKAKDKLEEKILLLNRIIVSKLMSLKDYAKLKYDTMIDVDISFAYTVSFLKKLIEALKRELEKAKTSKKPSKARTLYNLLNYFLGKNIDYSSMLSESTFEEKVLEKAVQEAHSEAEQVANNVRELKNIASGSRAGKYPGLFISGEFLVEALKLAETAYVTEILKNVKNVLTKTITIVHKEKRDHKHGVYDGVTLGKDISRILPRELTLENDVFYKKLVDSELLLRKRILIEKVGPLYVLLDKCLAGNTLITFGDGSRDRIETASEGDTVVSLKFNVESTYRNDLFIVNKVKPTLSRARIKEVICSGLRDIYKIETEHGSFYATLNHSLPVIRNSVLYEAIVANLRKGDYLLRVGSGKEFEITLSRVKKVIYYGKERAWDIVLSKDHYFVANGFVVHNSGSMIGKKTIWARAIALALFKQSREENREFYLRFFDYMPHELIRVRRRARPKEIQELFMSLLTIISSGGTWIAKAIDTACRDIIKNRVEGVSTIVLITDGIDAVHEDTVKSFLEEANAELITVMIGGLNETLRRVSKKYFVTTMVNDVLTVKEM
ncbi:MAG: hypothetical protein DRO23_09835 [Thermoprotei archaeon]|nr:MAG: hypothetical protein DRO23_09835 [Thermoprotei archaeon]